MSVYSKFKSVAGISLLLCYRVGDSRRFGGIFARRYSEGVCEMAGKNENREWGSYNTYSKENKELMAAEFWFTLKLNFRFLFILQII